MVKNPTKVKFVDLSNTDILNAFWSKVDIKNDDECWDWQGKFMPDKYGYLSYGHDVRRAHRISCELAYGPPTKVNPWALHSCDRRCCVNPKHLRWGTRDENNREAFERNHNHWYNAGLRLRHINSKYGRRFTYATECLLLGFLDSGITSKQIKSFLNTTEKDINFLRRIRYMKKKFIRESFGEYLESKQP